MGVLSGDWVSPNKHNVIKINDTRHHVVVVPDRETLVVNIGCGHSV